MSQQTELTKKVVKELIEIVESSAILELGPVEKKTLRTLFTEVINRNFWRTYDT